MYIHHTHTHTHARTHARTHAHTHTHTQCRMERETETERAKRTNRDHRRKDKCETEFSAVQLCDIVYRKNFFRESFSQVFCVLEAGRRRTGKDMTPLGYAMYL